MKKINMVLFFCSDFVSGFAICMTLISLNWVILQKTQSSLQVSYLTIANMLGSFMVSLFGGMLTDRYERKKILSGGYFFSAAFLLFIIIFMKFFGFQIVYLYFCSVMNGAIWALYLLASKSFLQEMLNGENFIKGTSFIEITLQLGTLTAGLFTGVLLKYLDISKILLLNFIAFLICSLLISNIQHAPTEYKIKEEQTSIIQCFFEGLRYMSINKNSFVIGIISVIPLAVTALFNVILPVFVSEVLNSDSFIYGVSDMLYGVGAVLAGILITYITKKSIGYKGVYLAFVVAMFIYFPMYRLKSISLFWVCCLIFGIANVYIKIVSNAKLMVNVPSEYMGRFLSIITAISLLVQSAGAWLTGYLIDIKGSMYGFLIMFMVLLIGLVIYIYIEKNNKINLETGEVL